MTPRDNVLRTLRRQGFDQVPLDCDLCPSQLEAFKARMGHTRVHEFFRFQHAAYWFPLTRTFADGAALFPRETLPPNTAFDAFGVGHSHHEGCFHMTRMHHPLGGDATLAEIQTHPLPVLREEDKQALHQWNHDVHTQGLATCGGMACTVWETAWYLRSMEALMMDMHGEDDRAVVLLDRITDLSCERARTYARSGIDILQLGDDVGMQSQIMMSLPMWRTWIRPRLARVIAAAREVKPDILVWYHSCGHVLPFIEDFIAIGIDILNPIQPESMTLEQVQAIAKGRLSYWGTIGTQGVLPFGTPEQVREEVWKNLRLCGPSGGILIAPTHLVEPEVPWANLVAMKEAADTFRG